MPATRGNLSICGTTENQLWKFKDIGNIDKCCGNHNEDDVADLCNHVWNMKGNVCMM